MELHKILWNLVENPGSPRFYRELRDYYQKLQKTHEAAAVDYLIEQRFGKKNEHDTTDDTFISTQQ